MIFQLSVFIWNCLPKDEPLRVHSHRDSELSLSCGSCADITWDRLTASRGSICDYSLQRHFQKSASLWDPPGAPALFCFISFGVFNVTQCGIMGKGNLKAPPPPAGRPSRALLLSRGPNLVCLSVAQKMHLQLCWVERKITAFVFFFFSFCLFVPINVLPLFLSSFPSYCTVSFWICVSYFMVFWIAQDQLFWSFLLFRVKNSSVESSAVMWFVAVHPFPLDSSTQNLSPTV